MPRVVVVLDIDTYAKDARKVPFKGLIEKGELELGGSCPQCGKDFLDVGQVLYGKPVLADGSDWYNSGKSFFDGGMFTYETQSLEWLFENYQLWNRDDSIIVCSRECAEVRELRFRQTQAEIEMKINPSDGSSFQAESVVIHGSETPASKPSDPTSPLKPTLEVPSSPAPPTPSFQPEMLEVPASPGIPTSPLPSSPTQGTPTTFKKGGRAPPPPPPRSPVPPDTRDIKPMTEDTNPFSPAHSNPFVAASSPSTSPASFSSLSPTNASSSSSTSSSLPTFENPFADVPLSPSKKSDSAESKVLVDSSKSEQGVGWCLEELGKLQSVLTEATRRIAELTAVLETHRRSESSHPPPPLPPLPEDDPVKRTLSPPPVFTPPVVNSEADDVN